MFAQIVFKLMQELFAGRAILCALRGIRINSLKIIATDEKIAGETAAVLEWIAGGFSQLERFALAFRHLRRVDDGRRRPLRLRTRFLGDLFLRRFERRLHINPAVMWSEVETSLIFPKEYPEIPRLRSE